MNWGERDGEGCGIMNVRILILVRVLIVSCIGWNERGTPTQNVGKGTPPICGASLGPPPSLSFPPWSFASSSLPLIVVLLELFVFGSTQTQLCEQQYDPSMELPATISQVPLYGFDADVSLTWYHSSRWDGM